MFIIVYTILIIIFRIHKYTQSINYVSFMSTVVYTILTGQVYIYNNIYNTNYNIQNTQLYKNIN